MVPEIDALDLLVRIRPIPKPVSVQPRIRFVRPASGPITVVPEPALRRTGTSIPSLQRQGSRDLARFHEPLVRPARQGHRLSLHVQFNRRVGLKPAATAESAQFKRNHVRDPRVAQHDLAHLAARFFRKPCQHCLVGRDPEPWQRHGSSEPRRFRTDRPVNDRFRRRSQSSAFN